MIESRRTFLRTTALLLTTQRFSALRCAWGGGASSEGRTVSTTAQQQGVLRALNNATAWINSPPLTEESLRGKVVLVEFWTFTCINWLRTLPYVRAWAQKYKEHGLVVIGAHSPEFSFEHNVDNVRREAKSLNVNFPIAVDSDFAIWRGFNNEYWPALYFVDGKGVVRHEYFGEGAYVDSERKVQELLTEAGYKGFGRDIVAVAGKGAEAAADWGDLRTPETYVGRARGENFDSPGGISLNSSGMYSVPSQLPLNHWALAGEWKVSDEKATSLAAGARIVFRFYARDVHLVMGPPVGAKPVRFRVRVDGQPPGAARGGDVDAQGNGVSTAQRLHQLIRQPPPISDRRFEIEFLDSGVEAFVFTFG